MSSSYAGNPATYPASITIPADGDTRGAASVNAGLEGLANRTAHLYSKVNGILRVSQLIVTPPVSVPFNGVLGGGPGGTIASQVLSLDEGDTLLVHVTGQLSVPGVPGGPAGGVRFWLNAATPYDRTTEQITAGIRECAFHCAYVAPADESLGFSIQAHATGETTGAPFQFDLDAMTFMVLKQP